MTAGTIGASILAAAALASSSADAPTPIPSITATTTYHRAQVDGVRVFYREAGPKDAPVIVLLHGFPSSSREFDTLIPLLATRYRLIAPDFRASARATRPPLSAYRYTFDNLAETTDHLLQALKITRYSLYIHDYGAPVGMRLILAHPERLQALITQNGNVYRAGLGPKWSQIEQFWADPKAHPEVIDAFLSPAATEARHTAGTSHPERYNPDTWTDEIAHLAKPGPARRPDRPALRLPHQRRRLSGLAGVAPPAPTAHAGRLGPHDPSFIAAGASAFHADLPDAEIHLLDAGHFALDEKSDEIAALILDFMARHVPAKMSPAR